MKDVRLIVLDEKDPYKRGVHHGEELREEIAVLLDAWRYYLQSHFSKFGGLLRYKATTKFYYSIFKRHIPSYFLSEMKGVADGANCRLSEIAFLNCFDDAFRILFQRSSPCVSKLSKSFWKDFENKTLQCSSFACRRMNGKIIAGVNLDEGVLEKELCRLVTAFIYKGGEGEPDIMSVLIPGYIGVLRGMNNKGIFLGHHTAHATDVKWPRIPHGLLLREALTKISFQDVCRVILKRQRTIGSNIIIGNSTQARVLEMSAKTHNVRYPENQLHGQDYIVCTNHFITNAMLPLYKPEYVSPGVDQPEYIMSPEYSKWRFKRLSELLSKKLPKTPLEACRVLEAVANGMTVQTVVFDPADLAAWIAVPCNGFPPAPRNCKLFKVSLKENAQNGFQS